MAITAAMVKTLRDKTGLPMMECKKALTEAGGDQDQAIEILRKMGAGKIQKMATREATEGRIACFVDPAVGRAGIVELRCETAPVAGNEQFVELATTIAQSAAALDVPNAETIREEPLPGDSSKTIGTLMDEVFNRMRENMKIARVACLSGDVGQYVHHNGQVGVLIQMSGPCSEELKSDLCMHIAALNPPCLRREDADPKEVEQQQAVFAEEAQGKPAPIVEKIVGGKMNRWYSEFVLLDQPFVKDDKKSVAQVLKAADPDLTVSRLIRFEVGGV
jgi:elongation factor Ts